jgi:hypothetical protein
MVHGWVSTGVRLTVDTDATGRRMQSQLRTDGSAKKHRTQKGAFVYGKSKLMMLK